MGARGVVGRVGLHRLHMGGGDGGTARVNGAPTGVISALVFASFVSPRKCTQRLPVCSIRSRVIKEFKFFKKVYLFFK